MGQCVKEKNPEKQQILQQKCSCLSRPQGITHDVEMQFSIKRLF